MKQQVFIAPIVEGHGEVQALPVLLQRVAKEVIPEVRLKVNPALRVKCGSFIRDHDYFRRYIELAARKSKLWPKSCVLILLDSEDECPAQLGPRLLARARACRLDVHFEVILAHREYETWFLAAARSLRGVCGLASDVDPPTVPEGIRDAKGWLSQHMAVPYNEPDHQPRLTAAFDFEQAAGVPSFKRGLEKLQNLFRP